MPTALKLKDEGMESKSAQNKIRVTVTIPDDIRDLFSWYLAYDSKYKGNAAGLASDMLRTGLLARYNEGLAEVPSQEKGIYKPISENQLAAFKRAAGE